MGFFSDLVHYQYLLNAFTACLLSGITCGVIGTYVVCRRMVFLAGGITHASFGGLGIAFWLGASRPSASSGPEAAGASARIRPSASSGRWVWPSGRCS